MQLASNAAVPHVYPHCSWTIKIATRNAPCHLHMASRLVTFTFTCTFAFEFTSMLGPIMHMAEAGTLWLACQRSASPIIGYRRFLGWVTTEALNILYLDTTSCERRSTILKKTNIWRFLFSRPSWTHHRQTLHGLSGHRASATAGHCSIKRIYIYILCRSFSTVAVAGCWHGWLQRILIRSAGHKRSVRQPYLLFTTNNKDDIRHAREQSHLQ